MIADNLKEIREEIEKFHKPVQLMAVSKHHSWEAMLEAYEAGQRLFGENRVQEIEQKIPSERPEGMELHLIGHLQCNKVNKVVPLVDAIDSVDSVKLMRKIEKACVKYQKRMPVLLELNTSGEENKSGFSSPRALYEALTGMHEFPHLSIYGLMTVAPLSGGDEAKREAFRMLKEVQGECEELFPLLDFSTLSMGMSGDFPIAIEEGSTIVRVGTAIFGAREY